MNCLRQTFATLHVDSTSNDMGDENPIVLVRDIFLDISKKKQLVEVEAKLLTNKNNNNNNNNILY